MLVVVGSRPGLLIIFICQGVRQRSCPEAEKIKLHFQNYFSQKYCANKTLLAMFFWRRKKDFFDLLKKFFYQQSLQFFPNVKNFRYLRQGVEATSVRLRQCLTDPSVATP